MEGPGRLSSPRPGFQPRRGQPGRKGAGRLGQADFSGSLGGIYLFDNRIRNNSNRILSQSVKINICLDYIFYKPELRNFPDLERGRTFLRGRNLIFGPLIA
jgi:hypothetical protein